MAEIWLQSNRRAYLLPIIAAEVLTVASLALAAVFRNLWIAIVGASIFSLLSMGLWLASRRAARIAYDGRNVRLHIGLPQPAVIPVELVEGFFLGKGPAYLKGKDDYKTETSTLIVRVAERAPEWEKLPTDVRVAAWCGHHITFRGTWTEPLNVEVANRLNQRLYDVQHAAPSPTGATS